MSDPVERLQILMGDTLQILDHMKVDSGHHELFSAIKTGLNEQNRKIAELANYTGEERLHAAVSMTKKLSEIENKVQHLETSLMEDYKNSTENQIEQYEQMSLEEQVSQSENYHNKIDYLSAAKIRENVHRMNEVLLRIRS